MGVCGVLVVKPVLLTPSVAGFADRRALPGCWWIQANSLGAAAPRLGGTVRVCGGRREPIHGGLVAASMRLTPPQTRPDPPSTVGRRPGESNGRSQHRLRLRSGIWHLIFHGHQYTVEGRRGRVCGTVKNMDVFAKPPWMGLRRVPQTRTRRPSSGHAVPTGCSPKTKSAGQSPAPGKLAIAEVRYATSNPVGNCMVMQCRLPFCQISERQGTCTISWFGYAWASTSRAASSATSP